MAKAFLSKLLHAILDHSKIPASGMLSAGQYAAISGGTTGFYTDVSGFPWTDKVMYNDSMVPGNILGTGPSAPSLATFLGNIQLYEFHKSPQADTSHFTIQLPHDYKIGGDIYPHVHLSHISANAATGTSAAFSLEYAWASIGSQFPTATTTISANVLVPSAQYSHFVLALPTITGSPSGVNKGISSQLVCRLARLNTAADTFPDGSLFVLQFDFHYPVDTFGSRQEFIK